MTRLQRADAEKLVASIGIPPRPTVVVAVMEAKSSDDVDLAALVKAIATDVGIAAALIKTVNSPLYGLHRRVTAVAEAAALLGVNNLATLVTSLALKSSLAAGGIERFWDQSARIALLSHWLAGKVHVNRDEAHLFGLFRDAGIPLLLKKFPDYRDTLKHCNLERERAFTAVEDERHGVNHAVVGALMARNWRLSDALHDAVLRHHEPGVLDSPADDGVKLLIAIGHLAGQLECRHARGADDPEWLRFAAPARALLMVAEDDVTDFGHESESMLLESGF